MTTEFKNLLPSMKVKVEYPDKTSRETTVSELQSQMKGETKEWLQSFFGELDREFTARGAFAQYTILLS